MGAIFRGITVEDHIKIVHEAVKQGINYLDCAPFFNFGRAEEVLGQVRPRNRTVVSISPILGQMSVQ